MRFPAEDEATGAAVAALVRAEPARFGMADSDTVDVRLLGTGESYAAWLVRVAARTVVVRVARRSDLPRPMAAEFAALALVPAGLGPRPVALEESADPLGSPFMVVGYVPGRVVEPSGWSRPLLVTHVRALAALHTTSHTRCGDLVTPIVERSSSISITGRFADSLAWWRQAHPDIVATVAAADGLLSRAEAVVAAAEPAFARLHRFALVHGDLVVPNILVDGLGTPRYVHWEWAEIGDPAQDLAYLGGAISAPPWYLPLDRSTVELLARTHLAATPDRDRGDLADLHTRRDAWEVFERLFSALHFRTRCGSQEDRRTGLYTDAVRRLTTQLDGHLPT